MDDRVLIVMDDPFELSTIGAALKLHGTNVIGEARKGSIALTLMKTLSPNILLIDMHVTDEHSIEIASTFRRLNPNIGIVILVACADLRLLGEESTKIPKGTKLVIKKNMNNVALLCEILSDSRKFNSHSPVTWVNGTVFLHEKSLHNMLTELTDIQVQTLRLVARGLTNGEISKIRYVSEKAVEQIVSRIAQILNLQPDQGKNMRVQLVNEYLRWIGAPNH